MAKWIDVDEHRFQCSKCMKVIEHMRSPKKCPNCGAEMKNAFDVLFPPNNWTPKKRWGESD